VFKISPSKTGTRSSNVYTINVPSNFKKGVLDQSQKFGGASKLITMSLGDMASRLRQITSGINIVEEMNDYIKLEILLMQRFEEESRKNKDSKLSFRLKDSLSEECLSIIKEKTGWSTSKAVRISLIWYLSANFETPLASEDYVTLLRCPQCDFTTHDQRNLGVHIQSNHDSLYRQERIPSPLQKTIDQYTSTPVSRRDSEESKLLQELGLEDLGTLTPTEEETETPTLDRIDLKEIIEERLKEKETKKGKDERIDKLESEISEILESLREDGIID